MFTFRIKHVKVSFNAVGKLVMHILNQPSHGSAIRLGHLNDQMRRIVLEEGEVIQHSMMTKSIERAQKKVEGRNFDIRKTLLKFDCLVAPRHNFLKLRSENYEKCNIGIFRRWHTQRHIMKVICCSISLIYRA